MIELAKHKMWSEFVLGRHSFFFFVTMRVLVRSRLDDLQQLVIAGRPQLVLHQCHVHVRVQLELQGIVREHELDLSGDASILVDHLRRPCALCGLVYVVLICLCKYGFLTFPLFIKS